MRTVFFILATVCATSLVGAQDVPLKKDVEEIRHKIDEAKRELEANEATKADASDALRESEVAISDANRALAQVGHEQQLSQAELARINSDIVRTRHNLDASRDRIRAIIRARFRNGNHEAMRLILNAQAPADTARNLEYYRHIAAAQQKLTADLGNQLDKLNKLAEDIKQKSDELERLAEEKRKQRALLQASQAERQKVLSSLANEIKQQRKQINKLQADEQSMTLLMERLARETREREVREAKEAREKQARAARQAAKAATEKSESGKPVPGKPTRTNDVLPDASLNAIDFAGLKGKLRLPVKGDVLGKYGQARGDGMNWKGLFVRTSSGMPVKAVASGTVVHVGWFRTYGNVIIIEHGGDYLTLYGTAESILKKKGDKVSAGDDIATTGNSGGNAETGIYFELRHKGLPIDPQEWLR